MEEGWTGIQDLNNYRPLSCGWTLNDAFAINDSGQIVGIALDTRDATIGFILTPN